MALDIIFVLVLAAIFAGIGYKFAKIIEDSEKGKGQQ